MSWIAPSWLFLAFVAMALLPVAALVSRERTLHQARIATSTLWRRWLGATPATGAARATLWLAAAGVAAIAAAGPRWGHLAPTDAPGLDLAIALDVSDSMRCTDVQPSRLAQAVAVVREALARRPPGNAALVVGGSSAEPLVPLTPDRTVVGARIGDPQLARWVAPGTNLSVLLATAAAQLATSASARTILLVSDGEELEGDAAAMGEALRSSGTSIVTVSSGTTAGAPVPREDAGGRSAYVRGANGEPILSHANPGLLARIAGVPSHAIDAASPAAPRQLAELLTRLARASSQGDAPTHVAAPALAAALLATASFLLWPWRRRALATALLPLPLLAVAPTPPSTAPLWQRLVPGSSTVMARRAATAASRGAWEEATRGYDAALALDPRNAELRLAWAAASACAGDAAGEAALDALARQPQLAPTALFDLGTCRLLRGDGEGAAAALRRAVALDVADAAAWRNLQLAQGLLQQAQGSRAQADPLASARRDRLVRAAASAALQPLILAAPVPSAPGRGRDW